MVCWMHLPTRRESHSSLAYNAFVRYGSSSRFCGQHAINFRALSRAVNVRAQLKRYMQRFGIWPLERWALPRLTIQLLTCHDSCEGDAKRLRKCLVSGYADASNLAKWAADGTYRSLRGDKVSSFCFWCVNCTVSTSYPPTLGTPCTSNFCAFHP